MVDLCPAWAHCRYLLSLADLSIFDLISLAISYFSLKSSLRYLLYFILSFFNLSKVADLFICFSSRSTLERKSSEARDWRRLSKRDSIIYYFSETLLRRSLMTSSLFSFKLSYHLWSLSILFSYSVFTFKLNCFSLLLLVLSTFFKSLALSLIYCLSRSDKIVWYLS